MKTKTIGINRDKVSPDVFENLTRGGRFLQFTSYRHPYNSPIFSVLNEGMGILWITGPSLELEDFVRTYRLEVIYRSSERESLTENTADLFYIYE